MYTHISPDLTRYTVKFDYYSVATEGGEYFITDLL